MNAKVVMRRQNATRKRAGMASNVEVETGENRCEKEEPIRMERALR